MISLLLIVLLTSALPDLGQPSVMAIAAAFGHFAGGLLAMCRRGREHIGRAMAEGSLAGYGTGLFVWIVVLAMDRL
jgi:hypothetical protein